MELIKREAPQLDQDGPVDLGSPVAHESHPERQSGYERWGSSSPEPWDVPGRRSTTTRDGIRIPGIRPLSTHELEYSGDELAHYSDFSDTPSQSYAQSSSFGSFVKRTQRGLPKGSNTPYAEPIQAVPAARNVSQSSGFHADQQDDEKVIWHGYLLCLKKKGGVRQWKRLWVVLRPKNLAFYKNDEVTHLPPPPHNPCLSFKLPNPGTHQRLAGVRRQPDPPPLKHHQRRRDRPHLPQQGPLHADHRRGEELPFLRQ